MAGAINILRVGLTWIACFPTQRLGVGCSTDPRGAARPWRQEGILRFQPERTSIRVVLPCLVSFKLFKNERGGTG
ncbi:hypothetical protein EM20IM_07100 [Candidatus Methylacidiphilum infernorum]|uniref:Secreted protein n=1 Tax=Candidatus Methylacidiphilum infernorum TaxID=511746 RepID=A0ABX7PTG6_9BACT|nr:hypothetical protein [Candidatus Methylacidiphilum infernorum]QSR86265.1 hypothetical protein EM20IM_07100 [Candidatus Methylacidiphilum infernorum]